MWLLVVGVSSHGTVGWSAVYDSGHTHLLLGCMWRYKTDKSCIRHDFNSVKQDHKEASIRVK